MKRGRNVVHYMLLARVHFQGGMILDTKQGMNKMGSVEHAISSPRMQARYK